MGQFFKFLFASILGVFIALFIFFIVISGMVASAISDAQKQAPSLKQNSVLELTFNQPIPEKPSQNPLENLSYLGDEFEPRPALSTYLDYIEKAAQNDNIQGIYLHLGSIPIGWSQLMEVRQALIDFRDAGKFVYAYGENYSQKAYLLASLADSVYLNPEGTFFFRGLSSTSLFFREALDDLEIEPQVFKVGRYKGAVEPFTRKDFSESNRAQIQELLNSVYRQYLMDLSEQRDIDTAQLRQYADSLLVRTPKKALEFRLVDDLVYEDEVLDAMRRRLALGDDEPVEQVDFARFKAAEKGAIVPATEEKSDKGQIAVVYAEGNIVSGPSNDGTIGSETLAASIRKARRDSTVKAVVLRVNSPGGSALASDVIAREIQLTQEQKPVIASMGNVAASGGYYISCLADAIVADPTTITGSIGVYAVFPNVRQFLDRKLGVTVDRVRTGPYGDFPSPTRPLREDEKAIFQQFIEDTYDSFLERVAEGRGMTTEAVHELAQGRVYTGAQAMDRNLVDQLGGFEDAVALAADRAGLEQYELRTLPKEENPFKQLLNYLENQTMAYVLDPMAMEALERSRKLRALQQMEGVSAMMPFELRIE